MTMGTMQAEFLSAFAHLLAAFGETVTLNRGGSTTEISAIRDRAFIEYDENDPAQKTRNTIPFRCRVSDYVFGSADTEPAKYDKITDAAGKNYNVVYWEIDATNQVFIVNTVEDAG